MLDVSSRHVSAYVNHNSGVKVVEASTKEFCIARHLYKTSDVCAAFNLGRVLAQRCQETGLYRVMWEHKYDREHKKVKCKQCFRNHSVSFFSSLHPLIGKSIY